MPITVGSGKHDLQKAVDASKPGDVLECPNDAVYGPLTLPGKRLDNEIRAKLLPTFRPSSTIQLPTIQSDTWVEMPIESQFGSSGVVLRGIKAECTRVDTSDNPSSVVCLGQHDLKPAISLTQLPRDITLDRCVIRGNSSRTMHGLIGNVINLRLSYCLIDGIVHGNAESHGVYIDDTPGPVVIEHSKIIASGINVLVGGGSPWIPNQRVMSDGFVFRWNECTKLHEWSKDRGNVGVKNLFELKNCHYANIYGNMFTNCWPDNQQGMAILFTPREQNPSQYGKPARPAPLSGMTKVRFHNNLVTSVAGGIHVLASDDIGSAMPLGVLDIYGNEIHCGYYNEDNKAPGTAFLFGSNDRTKPAASVLIQDNRIKFAQGGAKALMKFLGPNPYFARSFTYTGNSHGPTQYGIFGNGGTMGEKALEAWCMHHHYDLNVEELQ